MRSVQMSSVEGLGFETKKESSSYIIYLLCHSFASYDCTKLIYHIMVISYNENHKKVTNRIWINNLWWGAYQCIIIKIALMMIQAILLGRSCNP